jgi:hypothetical protein
MMMDETEIRAKAQTFFDAQRGDNEQFNQAVSQHIATLSLDMTTYRPCPACESALCGVCGRCHEVDHEILFVGPRCPVAAPTDGAEEPEEIACVAWCWGFLFLRDAEKSVQLI